ncbi:MFS transporter [Paractinoplanes abujensis]|uniref:MFS family permease n=1 Tax=Paractinoplanes abujensis TaxID=882441 RepID=A0A7W7G3D4_9ACTN|nr:MFS transporter [Actinoplanes abujensis]MBB4694554.1 MFS family permease [Actinoplanes abujensis]GID20232.1 MFS transporter [Actinoplanes abujensis]
MAVAHGVPVLATPVEPVRRSWIGLLFAANLGLWMAYFTPIQVLLPEQVAEITPDSKELWLGIVTGIGAIVAIVVNPLAGALSDRTRIKLFGRPYGRRHVWTLAGCALSVLSIAVLAEARNLFTVIVAWCFVTVGINIMLASLTAAVPDRVPVAQRGLVSGWIGMPQALGLVVGAVLVTAVLTDIGPGYIALGLGLVVLAVPFALLTKDDPLPTGHKVRAHWKIDLRGHPDYMWAWGTRFLVQLGNALGTLYLLYFLDDAVGLDDPDTGLLYMILLYTVGMISTAMIGGWLSDRVGRRKIFVIWSGVLIAIAATLLAIWPTWAISLVAAFLFGMGFGVYLAVDTALITQVLPSEADRAKDLGVINIASAAPQALGPLLAAPIVTSLGGYPTLFALTALVSLVGAVAVVKIRSVP